MAVFAIGKSEVGDEDEGRRYSWWEPNERVVLGDDDEEK